MKNRMFIFDLDDTLYKEIDFLYSAYREIANWIELKFNQANILSFMLEAYKNKADVFTLLIETYGLPLTKSDLLILYRSHNPDIQLDPETLYVLNVLHQKSGLGIITDGRSTTQRNKFCSLGLSQFIENDDFLISEEFGSEKPSADNFLYFHNRYVDSDFIYVGDNLKKDFISPNKLGWKTICLLDDGRNIHPQDFDQPEEYLPNFKIQKLNDILFLNI